MIEGTCDEDDMNPGGARPDLRQEIDAAHPRHHEVRNDEIIGKPGLL